jgi:uncharacterized protein (TIGR02271 family)
MADTNKNAGRDTNPDLITGTPGSHPVATGVGAAAAGAAGAAIGSIVPGIGTVVGGVVGAIAGSVGGGYAGKAVGEMMDPTGTDEYWKEQHVSRDYAKGTSYDDLKPAYQYGATLADRGESPEFDETRARSDWESSGNKSLDFDRAAPAMRDEFDRKMKLREEQLRIEKERVTTGEVSLRKEVTTERKTVEVPVEREEVVITRRDVSGGESSADAGTIGDEEIRIPVSEERVNVSKETVVTGEVEIGKRKTTGTETVSDDVRKEHVRLENQGNVRVDDLGRQSQSPILSSSHSQNTTTPASWPG